MSILSLLVTGLEPILYCENQILSLTCLPIPPNELMAQFDNLIICPLVCYSIIILFVYYYISIKIMIPQFFEAKKMREKQLKVFSVTSKHDYLICNLIKF